MEKAFNEGCSLIGITEEQRKGRKLVFHSLRHYHIWLVNKERGERVAQLASGHKSLSMVQHYADHIKEEDIAELASARTALFTYKSIYSK